jgi:hypothetical protein
MKLYDFLGAKDPVDVYIMAKKMVHLRTSILGSWVFPSDMMLIMKLYDFLDQPCLFLQLVIIQLLWLDGGIHLHKRFVKPASQMPNSGMISGLKKHQSKTQK